MTAKALGFFTFIFCLTSFKLCSKATLIFYFAAVEKGKIMCLFPKGWFVWQRENRVHVQYSPQRCTLVGPAVWKLRSYPLTPTASHTHSLPDPQPLTPPPSHTPILSHPHTHNLSHPHPLTLPFSHIPTPPSHTPTLSQP